MLKFSVLHVGKVSDEKMQLLHVGKESDEETDAQLAMIEPTYRKKNEANAKTLRRWNMAAFLMHFLLMFVAPVVLEQLGYFSADFEFAVTGIDSSGIDIPKKNGEYPFLCPGVVAERFRDLDPSFQSPFPITNGTDSRCKSVEQYDYMMTHEPVCSLEDNERCDLLTYRSWVCPNDKTVDDAGYEKRCDTSGRGGGGNAIDARTTYFTIRLFDWLLAFPLLTAMFHMISYITATAVSKESPFNYERHLMHLRQPIRWVEYSITSSIMQVGCANLCGITDAYSLVNQFALSISTNLFGLAIDLVPGIAAKWAMFAAGCVGFISSWFQLLSHFMIAFSPILENEDFAQLLWFVPLVVWSLFISYLTFPIVTAVVISRMQRKVSVLQKANVLSGDSGFYGEITSDLKWYFADIVIDGERWYIILSFAAKFVLIAIVASAAIGRPSDE